MTNKIMSLSCLFLLFVCSSHAQEEAWTLDRCIEYAQQNNINVQQRSIQTQDKEIQLNTARNSRLPSLNASLGSNASFGRSLSRDNTYQSTTQISGSVGASASITLFQGLRIKHQIEGSQFDLKAAMQDLERARDDIALNVTSYYLQILLNKELVRVAEQQLELSRQSVERSRALVASGKQPESTLYESEALAAKDELSLTQAKNELVLSLLDLSQALNRESAEGFDIQVPQLDGLTLTSMGQLPTPNEIYQYAEETRPQILAEQFRLQSSLKSLRIAKSALYPQISASGGYGTNMYHSFTSGARHEDFWSQIRHNGSEYIGMSINIPIFNRKATRNQISSAALSVQSQQLALDESKRSLRKEIEQSYYNAQAAYQKYLSAEKALASAKVAFEYEQKRSDAGRSTIFDYNDAKTQMQKAESDLLQAKFDFVFRCKILDFYAGKPLEFERY